MADGSEKATFVAGSSYRVKLNERENFSKPKNKTEAAFQQHLDLEKAMIKFVNLWVEMDVPTGADFFEIFANEIRNGMNRMATQGHKAKYRKVVFGSTEPDDVGLNSMTM